MYTATHSTSKYPKSGYTKSLPMRFCSPWAARLHAAGPCLQHFQESPYAAGAGEDQACGGHMGPPGIHGFFTSG